MDGGVFMAAGASAGVLTGAAAAGSDGSGGGGDGASSAGGSPAASIAAAAGGPGAAGRWSLDVDSPPPSPLVMPAALASARQVGAGAVPPAPLQSEQPEQPPRSSTAQAKGRARGSGAAAAAAAASRGSGGSGGSGGGSGGGSTAALRYEPYFHLVRSVVLGDARWRAAEAHFPPVSPLYVLRDPTFAGAEASGAGGGGAGGDAPAPLAYSLPPDLPAPCSTGASGLPAAAEQRIARMVQRWRANFLAACQPRALPAGWSVDYRVLQSGLRREGMTETPLALEAIALLAGRAQVE